MNDFFLNYYDEYRLKIFNDEILKKLIDFKDLAIDIKSSDKKIVFAGNGASASIASHGSVDFTKQAKVRAINFNEANLITCFSNDYGYENWVAEAIKCYAEKGDMVTLISVSGESKNLINAAKISNEMGLNVITFTGRSENNSLKKLGKINFWVDSNAYNIVECIHMIWLTSVIDSVIGKAEYEVS